MNTCKTCKNWKPFLEEYPRAAHSCEAIGGFCESDKLIERSDFPGECQPDMLIYSYYEGGSFWTGPEFGCVHHAPKGE